ncbi:uncharacterized protein [Argopecten irradians]|uniref:uncharacterized protein n=1 Tax=Argopecten irradians TaxID=31199 RepID=UPI0037180D96
MVKRGLNKTENLQPPGSFQVPMATAFPQSDEDDNEESDELDFIESAISMYEQHKRTLSRFFIQDDISAVAAQLQAFRQRCDEKTEPSVLERMDGLQVRLDLLSGVETAPPIQTDDLLLVTCQSVDPNTISDLELSANEQLETDVFYLNTTPLKNKTRLSLDKSEVKEYIQLHTQDNKETVVKETNGKVKVISTLDIRRKYVSYYYHLRDDDGWKKIDGDLKDGDVGATILTPTKAFICVTSRGKEYDVDVGPNGTEFRFASNRDVLIRFPKGAVQGNQQVHVSLESADRSAIQQMKRQQAELSIVGFTDILHIEHDEPFKKDICVELQMEMIASDDIAACDLMAVHFKDGTISLDQKGNKIRKVGRNKIKLETSLFTGKSIIAKRKKPNKKEKTHSESDCVCSVYGYNRSCCILVFLGEGPTNDSWRLWAEVVPERAVEDVAAKRVNQDGLKEPPHSRSPGKCFKKKTIIYVKLEASGGLTMYKGVAKNQSIVYQPKAVNNFVHFPVIKTKLNVNELAIVTFQSRAKKICDLHTAYFNPVVVLPLSSQASTEDDGPKDFFDSRSLFTLVQHIDINDLLGIATGLGLSMVKYGDLRFFHAHQPDEFKFSVFDKWLKSSTKGPEENLAQLTQALENCDNNSVAEICKAVFKEGRGLRKSDFK